MVGQETIVSAPIPDSDGDLQVTRKKDVGTREGCVLIGSVYTLMYLVDCLCCDFVSCFTTFLILVHASLTASATLHIQVFFLWIPNSCYSCIPVEVMVWI